MRYAYIKVRWPKCAYKVFQVVAVDKDGKELYVLYAESCVVKVVAMKRKKNGRTISRK